MSRSVTPVVLSHAALARVRRDEYILCVVYGVKLGGFVLWKFVIH